jgi:enoyl-CoA hydratase
MGLGLQLAAACDLRIATADARFAVPVARLGLMVDHWTVQRLSMLAGHSTARWLLLTGRPIDAARAHAVGLVHDVVDDLDDVDALAADIARLAPMALAGSKLGLDLLERDGAEVDPGGVYRAAFEAAWASDDLVEGRRAFREGRRPEFNGR